MCKFFSMVLTKDSCLWLEKSDSHEDIIKHFELHPDGARGSNIVRIELTPPADCDWADLAKWNYKVDQDLLPDWYEPTTHEAIARQNLAKRAKKMPWIAMVKSEVDAAIKWATCTDPADRAKAEAAALVLVPGAQIHWVNTPQGGDSLSDSLRDSLCDSLCDSLSDSLRDSLWDSLSASLMDLYRDSLWGSLRDLLRDSLSASLCDSLSDSFSDSLCDSLRASFWDSFWDSLRASFWDSHHTPLAHIARSLNPTASNPHWDAIEALHESCFAIWVLPGHVILCERPSVVEMRDGRVVYMWWKRHLEGKVA